MSTIDSTTEPTPVERARDELQDSVPKAARTLRDLLDADDERVQIRAAEAIRNAGFLRFRSPLRNSARDSDVRDGSCRRAVGET